MPRGVTGIGCRVAAGSGLTPWAILNALAAEAELYPDPPPLRPAHLHRGVVWTEFMLSRQPAQQRPQDLTNGAGVTHYGEPTNGL